MPMAVKCYNECSIKYDLSSGYTTNVTVIYTVLASLHLLSYYCIDLPATAASVRPAVANAASVGSVICLTLYSGDCDHCM